MDHYLTGDYICSKNFLCDHDHIKYLEADDYAKQILGNDTQKTQNKTYLKHIELIDENATTWKIAQVADIHTDLNYKEGSLGNCKDVVCCQGSVSKLKSSSLKFLGKFK